MRKLIFCILASLFILPGGIASAFDIPEQPETHVYDGAGVLTQETLDYAEEVFMQADWESKLITVESLGEEDINSVAMQFLQEWDLDMLYIVAPNDFTARFEATDEYKEYISSENLDEAFAVGIEYFVNDAYDEGIYASLVALNRTFEAKSEKKPSFILLGLILLPFIWIIISWLTDTKAWWAGGIFGGLFGFLFAWSIWGLVIGGSAGLLLDFLLSKFVYKFLKK